MDQLHALVNHRYVTQKQKQLPKRHDHTTPWILDSIAQHTVSFTRIMRWDDLPTLG